MGGSLESAAVEMERLKLDVVDWEEGVFVARWQYLRELGVEDTRVVTRWEKDRSRESQLPAELESVAKGNRSIKHPEKEQGIPRIHVADHVSRLSSQLRPQLLEEFLRGDVFRLGNAVDVATNTTLVGTLKNTDEIGPSEKHDVMG